MDFYNAIGKAGFMDVEEFSEELKYRCFYTLQENDMEWLSGFLKQDWIEISKFNSAQYLHNQLFVLETKDSSNKLSYEIGVYDLNFSDTYFCDANRVVPIYCVNRILPINP